MSDIVNKLSFKFIEKDFATKDVFINDGFLFDFVVQVRWDIKDVDTDKIMENDTLVDDCIDSTIYNSRNMTWIPRIKEIVLQNLNLGNDTILYMDAYKVMDGLVNFHYIQQ